MRGGGVGGGGREVGERERGGEGVRERKKGEKRGKRGRIEREGQMFRQADRQR